MNINHANNQQMSLEQFFIFDHKLQIEFEDNVLTLLKGIKTKQLLDYIDSLNVKNFSYDYRHAAQIFKQLGQIPMEINSRKHILEKLVLMYGGIEKEYTALAINQSIKFKREMDQYMIQTYGKLDTYLEGVMLVEYLHNHKKRDYLDWLIESETNEIPYLVHVLSMKVENNDLIAYLHDKTQNQMIELPKRIQTLKLIGNFQEVILDYTKIKKITINHQALENLSSLENPWIHQLSITFLPELLNDELEIVLHNVCQIMFDDVLLNIKPVYDSELGMHPLQRIQKTKNDITFTYDLNALKYRNQFHPIFEAIQKQNHGLGLNEILTFEHINKIDHLAFVFDDLNEQYTIKMFLNDLKYLTNLKRIKIIHNGLDAVQLDLRDVSNIPTIKYVYIEGFIIHIHHIESTHFESLATHQRYKENGMTTELLINSGYHKEERL